MAKANCTELFPILPKQPVGIARMAAEGTHADVGHLIEFKTLKVRSLLNWSVSKRRAWTAYSINPYRGCEFGCKYCYARYTHEFMAPKAPLPVTPPANVEQGLAEIVLAGTQAQPDFRDPLLFERIIFLKQNAAWLLEQELKKIDPAVEIALGTATDPYQPIERTARITRSLLEVFARKRGYRLGIVTKSRMIERDIDLLVEIARYNELVVHITITTQDAELARLLEPRAPRPDLRFRAVSRLRKAGIRTGILCCPLLPGITDSPEAIDGMARRAAEVRACFMAANPLFLKPCSRPTYLSFVREHFPSLVTDYEKRFGNADFASQEYCRRTSHIVGEACRRYGLRSRLMDTVLTGETGDAKKPPLREVPYADSKAAQRPLFA
ncbi:MAG: radical SAM protein [Acidobacteriota bacterium]|nr:radical SAM protein [Acidobacteriota bacterium]